VEPVRATDDHLQWRKIVHDVAKSCTTEDGCRTEQNIQASAVHENATKFSKLLIDHITH